MPVDPIVLGDARDAAARILEKLAAGPAADDGWDLAALAATRRNALADLRAQRGALFDPRAVVRAVDAHFPPDRTEIVGVGHFGGWPGMYSRLGRDGLFIGPWEFGAIGVGVPVALGAAIARPDRPTVVWEGDGSLQWALGELDTLARANARVTVIVLDDGAYGAEVWKLEKLGVSAAHAQFPRRDLAAVATALGVTGHAAHDVASLDAALAAASASSGPALLQVPIDPAHRQEVF
jgi:thiamine pyrophosphate-dependent acetolactate synthase large subunit-like protein